MSASPLATSSAVRFCATVKSSCSVMIFTSGPSVRRSIISSTQLVKKPGTRPPMRPMRIRPRAFIACATRICFMSISSASGVPACAWT